MKKRIISLFFLMIINITRLFAMDADYQKLLLTHETHQKQYKTIKQHQKNNTARLSCSLRDMKITLCQLTEQEKREALKNMTTQALMLSCAATYLPEDIVKNKICFFLFNCHKRGAVKFSDESIKAIEQFYIDPIMQALTTYNNIKSCLPDDTKPIGPLYLASLEKQNAILKVTSQTSYRTPKIDTEKKKLLKEMDSDLKTLYLKGTEVIIADDPCDSDRIKRSICSGIGAMIGTCVVLYLFALIPAGLPASDPHWERLLYALGPILGISFATGITAGSCIYSEDRICCCSWQHETL